MAGFGQGLEEPLESLSRSDSARWGPKGLQDDPAGASRCPSPESDSRDSLTLATAWLLTSGLGECEKGFRFNVDHAMTPDAAVTHREHSLASVGIFEESDQNSFVTQRHSFNRDLLPPLASVTGATMTPSDRASDNGHLVL
jgi:hypothetical protein